MDYHQQRHIESSYQTMTLYRVDTVYQRVKGMRREQQTLVGVKKELYCQRNKKRTTVPVSARNGRRAGNSGSVSLGFFNCGVQLVSPARPFT